MSYIDATSYFLTVVVITLAPGPIALILLVRSASRDIAGAIAFGLGYAMATVLIITAVCYGLGRWFQEISSLLEYSKYVMLAYILWVAYGILTGEVDLSGERATKSASVVSSALAGAGTCFISPYMMVLFPLVLPEIMNITQITLPDFAIAVVLTFLAAFAGSCLIIGFASQIYRLARSPLAMRRLNRTLAGALATGGVFLALN